MKVKAVRFYDGKLTATLQKTKTTGAGKRVRELPLYISEEAYVSESAWLEIGYNLVKRTWRDEGEYVFNEGAFDGPDRSWAYEVLRGLSKQWRDLLYEGERIFPENFDHFWLEHLGRSTLPSCLAAIGASKTDRDLIGRWQHSWDLIGPCFPSLHFLTWSGGCRVPAPWAESKPTATGGETVWGRGMGSRALQSAIELRSAGARWGGWWGWRGRPQVPVGEAGGEDREPENLLPPWDHHRWKASLPCKRQGGPGTGVEGPLGSGERAQVAAIACAFSNASSRSQKAAEVDAEQEVQDRAKALVASEWASMRQVLEKRYGQMEGKDTPAKEHVEKKLAEVEGGE